MPSTHVLPGQHACSLVHCSPALPHTPGRVAQTGSPNVYSQIKSAQHCPSKEQSNPDAKQPALPQTPVPSIAGTQTIPCSPPQHGTPEPAGSHGEPGPTHVS